MITRARNLPTHESISVPDVTFSSVREASRIENAIVLDLEAEAAELLGARSYELADRQKFEQDFLSRIRCLLLTTIACNADPTSEFQDSESDNDVTRELLEVAQVIKNSIEINALNNGRVEIIDLKQTSAKLFEPHDVSIYRTINGIRYEYQPLDNFYARVHMSAIPFELVNLHITDFLYITGVCNGNGESPALELIYSFEKKIWTTLIWGKVQD